MKAYRLSNLGRQIMNNRSADSQTLAVLDFIDGRAGATGAVDGSELERFELGSLKRAGYIKVVRE